jgi:hypothetical protein
MGWFLAVPELLRSMDHDSIKVNNREPLKTLKHSVHMLWLQWIWTRHLRAISVDSKREAVIDGEIERRNEWPRPRNQTGEKNLPIEKYVLHALLKWYSCNLVDLGSIHLLACNVMLQMMHRAFLAKCRRANLWISRINQLIKQASNGNCYKAWNALENQLSVINGLAQAAMKGVKFPTLVYMIFLSAYLHINKNTNHE